MSKITINKNYSPNYEILALDYDSVSNLAITNNIGPFASGLKYAGSSFSYAIFNFSIDSGIYTIYIGCEKNSSSGIIQFYLDGSEVGSLDLYNSSTQTNLELSISLINIASGDHELQILCQSKNSSSSAKNVFFSHIFFKKTGEYIGSGKKRLNKIFGNILIPACMERNGTNTYSGDNNTNCVYNMAQTLNGSSAAIGDYCEEEINISPATYDVHIYYRKNNNYGIFTVYIDGNSIGTIDAYSSSDTYFVGSTFAGIKLGGRHKIRIECTSKNVSSSGYKAGFSLIKFLKNTGTINRNLSKKLVISKNTINSKPLNFWGNTFDTNKRAIVSYGYYIGEFYSNSYWSGQSDGYLEFNVNCDAGKYYFRLWHAYNPSYNCNQWELFIDGSSQGTISAGGYVFLFNNSGNLFSLAKGRHTIKFLQKNNRDNTLGYCYMFKKE